MGAASNCLSPPSEPWPHHAKPTSLVFFTHCTRIMHRKCHNSISPCLRVRNISQYDCIYPIAALIEEVPRQHTTAAEKPDRMWLVCQLVIPENSGLEISRREHSAAQTVKQMNAAADTCTRLEVPI